MTDDETAGGDENAGGHDDAVRDRAERLRTAANRDTHDSDALERAHEDAQFTMEKTLELLSDLSGKAFRLIRLNALVLTILVAMASHVTVDRFVNVSTVASVVLLVGSAVFALIAYLTTTFNRGINAKTLETLTSYRLREKEYLNWILTRGYSEWIVDGLDKVNRKERWIRLSLVAFIAVITTLVVGILITLY